MDFLFELGVEELPSRYVKTSEKALEKNFIDSLKENRIEYSNIETFSTPRRLAVIVRGLSEKQKDLNEEKIGPSVNIALNDGKPTKALIGFLNSNGVSDYSIVKTDKGENIFIKKFVEGQKTENIMPYIIEESIKKLEFEKSMKWGANSFRFVRPIKWIVCLLDKKVLDFEFAGVKASNVTSGHRFFGKSSIDINSIDNYENILLENNVVANRDKRMNMILESIDKNCNSDKYSVDIDKQLLEEVTDLVEYPYAILGDFDEKYLKLPEQLITITMKTHQRYFPVRDSKSNLVNHFVVIRNAPSFSENVKLGNEKVIEPRLADSKFFFDEDLKLDLNDLVLKLKNVTFQKDMGSIYDKVQRAKKIASYLNANEKTIEAIHLCKADLLSNVISEKEFTNLQGLMGKIYALNAGYGEIVSNAIFEHYLPRFQSDILPSSIEGAIAAISDKLDTAMGAFCVGLKPTGSKDPYAIRRALQGVSGILFKFDLDVDYIKLSEKAYEIFEADKPVLYKNALEDFKVFFKQRIESILQEKYSKELIEYILPINSNIKAISSKLEKISKLYKTEDFEKLINLLKRTKNIVEDNKCMEVEENLFETNYEKELYDFTEKIENKDFDYIIDSLLENADIINRFFDNVKINVEDVKIAQNRKAILNNLLNCIGDIIYI